MTSSDTQDQTWSLEDREYPPQCLESVSLLFNPSHSPFQVHPQIPNIMPIAPLTSLQPSLTTTDSPSHSRQNHSPSKNPSQRPLQRKR